MGHSDTLVEGCLDLSACFQLNHLEIYVQPEFATDGISPAMLGTMLDSWLSAVTFKDLYLNAYEEDKFTRGQFGQILDILGGTLEAWVKDTQASHHPSTDAAGRSMQSRVFVRIFDLEEWRSWWFNYITDRFPTWAGLSRLEMPYRMGK